MKPQNQEDELRHIAVADRVPLYDPAIQLYCERCTKLANRKDLENHQREDTVLSRQDYISRSG